MLLRLYVCVAAMAACALAWAVPYQELYVDAVWSDLTGFSSTQHYRFGERWDNTAAYLYVLNDWYDTRNTDLPFQYSARGTTAGVGYRYWFPGSKMHASATVGYVFDGIDEDSVRSRVVVAGYDEWRTGNRIAEVYGDVSWVQQADDVFLNLRPRIGRVIAENAHGRVSAYGVGQLLASGSGGNGTENRIEAGVGIGYAFRGSLRANVELRAGRSFSGTINDRSFWNPTVVIAGGF